MKDKDIVVTDFSNDVSEYLDAEKNALEGFVNSLIKLGSVLSDKREKYKQSETWLKYVEAINKSPAWVSQIIRLFEYSKKDLKALLNSNITNWTKLHTFLALPDAIKKELSDDISGEEITTSEFVEKAESKKKSLKSDVEEIYEGEEIETENLKVEETVIEDSSHSLSDLNLDAIVNNASLIDTGFMANQLLKDCNESGDIKFSKNCLPFIHSVLELEKLMQAIEKNKLGKKLSKEEREYWVIQLKSQMNKTALVISNL